MTPLQAGVGGAGILTGWTLQDARHAGWNSGIGSATYGGRWNSIGKHVVYAALDPAAAILEVAVHKGFKVLNTVAHNLYSFTIADPGRFGAFRRAADGRLVEVARFKTRHPGRA